MPGGAHGSITVGERQWRPSTGSAAPPIGITPGALLQLLGHALEPYRGPVEGGAGLREGLTEFALEQVAGACRQASAGGSDRYSPHR